MSVHASGGHVPLYGNVRTFRVVQPGCLRGFAPGAKSEHLPWETIPWIRDDQGSTIVVQRW